MQFLNTRIHESIHILEKTIFRDINKKESREDSLDSFLFSAILMFKIGFS